MPRRVYLDTNVLYHGYCPTDARNVVEWLFEHLDRGGFTAVCSEWAILELFRAFKKQVNLGIIGERTATVALDFLLADVNAMKHDGRLELVPVHLPLIIGSRPRIFSKNLYAADALHAITAIRHGVSAFVTFDKDFKGDLGKVPLLNAIDASFKHAFARAVLDDAR